MPRIREEVIEPFDEESSACGEDEDARSSPSPASSPPSPDTNQHVADSKSSRMMSTSGSRNLAGHGRHLVSSFGYLAGGTAAFFSAQASSSSSSSSSHGVVERKRSSCREQGCLVQPLFGYLRSPGSGGGEGCRRECCSRHRLEGMVDLSRGEGGEEGKQEEEEEEEQGEQQTEGFSAPQPLERSRLPRKRAAPDSRSNSIGSSSKSSSSRSSSGHTNCSSSSSISNRGSGGGETHTATSAWAATEHAEQPEAALDRPRITACGREYAEDNRLPAIGEDSAPTPSGRSDYYYGAAGLAAGTAELSQEAPAASASATATAQRKQSDRKNPARGRGGGRLTVSKKPHRTPPSKSGGVGGRAAATSAAVAVPAAPTTIAAGPTPTAAASAADAAATAATAATIATAAIAATAVKKTGQGGRAGRKKEGAALDGKAPPTNAGRAHAPRNNTVGAAPGEIMNADEVAAAAAEVDPLLREDEAMATSTSSRPAASIMGRAAPAASRGSRLCLCQPCHTTACFGFPGGRRTSCGRHRQDGMVNLDRYGHGHGSAAVIVDGNGGGAGDGSRIGGGVGGDVNGNVGTLEREAAELASFHIAGRGGTGRASRLVLACRANGISCKKPRRFGFPGGAREVCSDHKVVGMVNFVEGGKVRSAAAESAGETISGALVGKGPDGGALVSSRNSKKSISVSDGDGGGGGDGGSSGSGARAGSTAHGTGHEQSNSLRKAVEKTGRLLATGPLNNGDVKPAVTVVADIVAAGTDAAASATATATATAPAGVRGKKKTARPAAAAGEKSSFARTGASSGKVTRTAVGGGKVNTSSSSPPPFSATESAVGFFTVDEDIGSGSGGGGVDHGGDGHSGGRNTLPNHKIMCSEEGCPISARFGYLSTRKRVCCGAHKRFGMVNLDKNPLKRRSAAPASSATQGDAAEPLVPATASSALAALAAAAAAAAVAVAPAEFGNNVKNSHVAPVGGVAGKKRGRKRKANDAGASSAVSGSGEGGGDRSPSQASVALAPAKTIKARAVKAPATLKCEKGKIREVSTSTSGPLPEPSGKARRGAGGGARGYKRCKHLTCLLHASFGFRDGRRDFCMVHQLPDMVNLVVESKKERKAAAAAEAAATVEATASVPKNPAAAVSAATGSETKKPSGAPPSKRQRCVSAASSPPSNRCAPGARSDRSDAVAPSRMTRTPVIRGGGAPFQSDIGNVKEKGNVVEGVGAAAGATSAASGVGAGVGTGAKARARVGAAAETEAKGLLGVQAGRSGETSAAVSTRVSRKGRCKASGCDLHASFGFPKGSRDFCAGHHLEGMSNLVYQSAKRGAIARVEKGKGLGGRNARTRRKGKGAASVSATAATSASATAAVAATAATVSSSTVEGGGGGGSDGGSGGVGRCLRRRVGGRGVATATATAATVAAAATTPAGGGGRGGDGCGGDGSGGGGRRHLRRGVGASGGGVGDTTAATRGGRGSGGGGSSGGGSGGGGGGGGVVGRRRRRGDGGGGGGGAVDGGRATAASKIAEGGLHPPKKSRRRAAVGVGGAGAGGSGGSSAVESGDGNRHRVWEGTRCGVCDRMAKLGEDSLCFFLSLVRFPCSGQAVVIGVVPPPPLCVRSFLSLRKFSVPTAHRFVCNYVLPLWRTSAAAAARYCLRCNRWGHRELGVMILSTNLCHE